MADVAGEVSVYGEIKPLENVADQAGERRAQRRWRTRASVERQFFDVREWVARRF